MRVAEPRDLDDGTRMRAPLPQPSEGADGTFVPDRRGLNGIALSHHSQQGDDAVMGEIDLLDGFSLFLQDHTLLRSSCTCALSWPSWTPHPNATALRPRARSRRRHW